MQMHKQDLQLSKKSQKGKGEIVFSSAERRMMRTMYQYKFTLKEIADKFMCARCTVRKNMLK